MSKPAKVPHAADPAIPNTRGRWLVLIGDNGEMSADDIEAFFAEICPEVEPEATLH